MRRWTGRRSGAKAGLLLCLIVYGACGSSAPVARAGDRRGELLRACLPTTSRRCVPDVLRPNGIAGLRFGAAPATVRAAIDSLLGQHGGAYVRGGSCHVEHEITWFDRRTRSGEPALTVYFGRSAFAGYQFGDLNMLSPPHKVPGGWSLATARGLRVGDTLARGRQLYGRAFAVSAAQGGSWAVRAREGSIRGYASGVPGRAPVGQILVATIDAGDVGCPAVSP